MTQENGRIPTGENYNQVLNSHQSLGGRFEEPQGRRQGQQSHPYPNNLIQGHHENKIGDSKTHSVVPYASSSKNTSSLIAAVRYDRMLPLTPPSGPPQDMGSPKNPLSLQSQLGPVQNSSFNGVGLQGYTNGFPYPLKTTFFNQMSLPYPPRGENSLRMNNSLVSNDFNPHKRANMNNFQSVRTIAMSRVLPPIQNQKLDHERAMKYPLYQIHQETEMLLSASKRLRMRFSPLDDYEGMQPQIKELLLFKDEENPISTSEIVTDAKENDEENLDLPLHL
ncbi:hypothetical protein SESBI_06768 [Sesbania bispinosa]|nr:hypothetical protein SESBI_06768 [Sesbania bispinosa]